MYHIKRKRQQNVEIIFIFHVRVLEIIPIKPQ